ncbi:hypothetical protein PsYK624_148210 [Phanerochaete sordida]|uniref:Uncharacterized protein n=1 Tax=Phanerochaete sordida TaxID=48140 RepID=A0A9P3GPA0_9APHY|nr:hypothetical protein PsYK624_148210 [Phanerochaete sordida]
MGVLYYQFLSYLFPALSIPSLRVERDIVLNQRRKVHDWDEHAANTLAGHGRALDLSPILFILWPKVIFQQAQIARMLPSKYTHMSTSPHLPDAFHYATTTTISKNAEYVQGQHDILRLRQILPERAESRTRRRLEPSGDIESRIQ